MKLRYKFASLSNPFIHSFHNIVEKMVEFPYDKSSFFNDIVFAWLFKPLYYFHKNPPTPSSIFQIPPNLDIEGPLKLLNSNWAKEQKKSDPRFLRAFIKTFGWTYLISVLLMHIGQITALIQGVFIKLLIDYLEDSTAPPYQGALLALAFIVTALISRLARSNSTLRVMLLTGQIKSIIARMVAEKVLKLNSQIITEEKIRGKILNTISTDMELLELMAQTVFFWCGPAVVLVSILIVTYMFGAVAIIGIGISVIHVPFIIFVGKIAQKGRGKAFVEGDIRVKMIENLIEGIKIMKLYGWEIPFLKIIYRKRAEEMHQRTVVNNWNVIPIILSLSGLGIIIYVTLLAQVYLGYGFSTGDMILIVSIFSSTHLAIVYVNSSGIATIFVLLGVIKRTGEILLLKEFEQKVTIGDEDKGIKFIDTSISWREPENEEAENAAHTRREMKRMKTAYKICLNSISVAINPGELVLVVGPVGCGKSSLLMSLLGELNISSGSIKLSGTVCYVSEEPWIISGSIKENIIMERTLDPELYTETLNSCDLIKDLEILGKGDETYVGDRGFTLSGGQRARLSLARAVYSQADIVLLDDPLSAVDPEVSNHIFNQCIKGQLKGKTVILATHQVQFLSQADKILVLDSGCVAFFGSYKKLKKRDELKDLLGAFAFQKGKKHEKKQKKTVAKEEKNEQFLMEEEEITDGSTGFKSYWRYLKYGMKSIIVAFIILLLLAGSTVIYHGMFYVAAQWSATSDKTSSYYIEGMGIVVMMCYVSFMIRSYFLTNCLLASNTKLHNKALKGVTLTNTVFFDKNPTGRIINRFSKDIGVADGPLQLSMQEAITTTILVLASVLIGIVILPWNLIVLPVFCFVMFFLLKYVSPIIIQLRKLELVARGPLLTTVTSCLNGLPTLRCLGLEEKFRKDVKNCINSHLRSYLTFHCFLKFNQCYADFGSTIVAALNVVIITAAKGSIGIGLAAFSLTSTNSLLGLTSLWAKSIIDLESSMSSAQRLLEYIDIEKEGEFTSKDAFQITKGKIKFVDVFMKYRPNLPYSLAGLKFTIKPGHKVGIIGRTGAGKSSILQVLFRLVNPESGTIFIDGMDYMQLGLHDLRKQMSVIPQSATLFAASLRDNLDPFHEHSDDEILQALDEVKLKEIVLECEEGLDIEVKNEGLSLSAGQKQLLCLARAILRKNKIIMMDEATANVDNETDRIIQITIKEKFTGATMLIIAHRIRTIIESDKIMVIDRGMCKEYARPEALYLQEDSIFKQMVHHTGPEESAFLIKKLTIEQ